MPKYLFISIQNEKGQFVSKSEDNKSRSEYVSSDMRACSLEPQNREAWRFGVGNSDHLLPMYPMSGTPAAVK